MRVRPGAALPGDADLIVLPGSKATIADLAALRAAGFDIDIAAHRRRGGMILGLCGGYQMLGRAIADPGGIEGPAAAVEGLGLLDVATTLSAEKRLEAGARHDERRRAVCRLRDAYGRDRQGRIARGHSRGSPTARPDGAVSADGRVIGTYVHGLFADDRQRAAWLARLQAARRPSPTTIWSSGRSMRLPRIWPRISISIACSA